MQIFAETIQHIAKQPWFLIFGILITVSLIFIWETASRTEWFARWWIKIQPNNPEAHIHLGSLLMEDDECYGEAEQEFQTAIKLVPGDRRGYLNLLILQTTMQKNDQAEITVQTLIKTFPDDPIAFTWKAWIFENEGKFQQAEEMYKKAISLTPRASGFLEKYANFLIEQNRLDEAEAVLERSMKIDPLSFDVNDYYLNLRSKQERLQEVEKIARRFVKLFPNKIKPRAWLSLILHSKGQSQEAIEILEKIIVKSPEYIWAYQKLSTIHYSKGEYNKTEEILQKALEKNPQNVEIYWTLGNFYRSEKIKQYEKAKTAYKIAIESDPANGASYNGLGLVLSENLKEYDEAETAFRKSIELDPSETTTYYNLSNLLRITGREHEAMSFLKVAQKMDPTDHSILLGIVSIKKCIGETVLSADIENIRQLIPKNELYDRACLESISNRADIAFEYLQRAIQEKEIDTSWAWEDPDLQWIRSDPRFVEIVGPKLED